MACKTAAAVAAVVVVWAALIYLAVNTLCDDLPDWA
jgi:hypothetical protein